MLEAGPKRIALSLEEDNDILAEIAVQEYAKNNASWGLGPGWLHQVSSPYSWYIFYHL